MDSKIISTEAEVTRLVALLEKKVGKRVPANPPKLQAVTEVRSSSPSADLDFDQEMDKLAQLVALRAHRKMGRKPDLRAVGKGSEHPAGIAPALDAAEKCLRESLAIADMLQLSQGSTLLLPETNAVAVEMLFNGIQDALTRVLEARQRVTP